MAMLWWTSARKCPQVRSNGNTISPMRRTRALRERKAVRAKMNLARHAKRNQAIHHWSTSPP